MRLEHWIPLLTPFLGLVGSLSRLFKPDSRPNIIHVETEVGGGQLPIVRVKTTIRVDRQI